MGEFAFELDKFLLIVLAAIAASSVSELLSWFLLYRKEDYRLNKCMHDLTKLRLKN
jgi:hypothetical protein